MPGKHIFKIDWFWESAYAILKTKYIFENLLIGKMTQFKLMN